MKVIGLRFFITLCMFGKLESSYEKSNFVIDYFVFKKVSYVVGFFCCSIEEKLTLLKKLNKFGIRTSFPHLDNNSYIFWLISSKYAKIGIFIDATCFDDNIIHLLSTKYRYLSRKNLRFQLITNHEHKLIIAENCDHLCEYKFYNKMMKASDRRLYDEMHSWIIFTGENVSKFVNQLDESGFGISTDLIVAIPISDGYELLDIYNPWKYGGGKINVTRFGIWNQNIRLNVTLTQSKFRRRCNLHNVTWKSNFFRSNYRPKDMPIDVYMQDESFFYKDGLSKFGYSLVVHLSEMFNFSLKFGEIKKWYPGDSLGPMTRALFQNEIQITGSPVIITQERLNFSKFVYPFWPFRTCFIFRNPQRKDIRIGQVLHPFTDESWYATVSVLVIIFSILALLLKKENCELSTSTLSNSFTLIVGSVCQQGTHFNFERISTRIVFFHLMVLCFFTYNYYNAVVVSAQLSESTLKINDSLNELGKLGFKMSSEPMNYFEFIFSQLNKWERKVFYIDKWLKIPESERFMNPEKAVILVRQGGFAYHTHPDASYPIIDKTFSNREICELMEVHPAIPRFSTLSVNYNSSFVELAKIGLSRMSEVGLRKRQLLKWTSRKPHCLRGAMNIESTDINEFVPHLMLLAIGMIMAGTMLIYEFILAKHWNNLDRSLVLIQEI